MPPRSSLPQTPLQHWSQLRFTTVLSTSLATYNSAFTTLFAASLAAVTMFTDAFFTALFAVVLSL
jgi:hypothetical protein